MIKNHLMLPVSFLGLVLWFTPHPLEISAEAWHLFALFVPTVIAIILKAMPIGSICIVAMSICLLTKTLLIHEGLSGFSNPVIWLIVLAFFIARSFIKTGLGNRIAYLFLFLMGRNSLSLAYGLIAGDLVLAPAIPSNTARAGGIMFPIVRSLATLFKGGSKAQSEGGIGSFLLLCSFHGNAITSAMFLTAMAANPLAAHLAGINGVNISWASWALAAIVPGLVSLAITPFIIYMLLGAKLESTKVARDFSISELKKLGPLSYEEKSLIGVFIFLLMGWIYPPLVGGVSATVVALAGLALLLLLGVLTWDDIKSEKGAWDTLVWFAILVTFAAYLDKLGFTSYLGSQISLSAQGLPWISAALILIGCYFFCHYLFASSTAHVSALYGTFLVLGIQLGVPALPFALLLGFTSNLYGGLTHYSIGHAPIFFGAGFVDIKKWWKIGFVVCSCNLLVWVFLGGAWMHFLGYFHA